MLSFLPQVYWSLLMKGRIRVATDHGDAKTEVCALLHPRL